MHTNEQRTAPGYGKEVIIASQGEGLLLLDATQLEFVAGDLASAQDSDVTLVYEAGDISGFTAMDNLFWSPNGRVYVNEDDGEGDIWQVDVNSLRASQAAGDTTPSPGQVTDVLDADGVRLGESAGIIDISEMIGEAPGTFFLTTGYASAVTDNQLAMLVAPKATNSPHGTLQVTQVNANNDSGAVDGELLDFTSLNVSYDDSGSSRGDFDLEFAPEFDNSSGVLFTAIAENGRDNSAFGDPAGTFYGTCAIDRDGDDYFIAASSSTGELNIDVAFAYLRKSDWLVGHAYNSSGTNGGANDVLNASPGINLGTQFIDNGGGNGSAILSEGFSTMLLRHCTIAGNTSEASGGAVANFANATLENTVIADNNHAQYADSGTTLFLGNNFTSGDPQLQSLADFGGPTRMMLPRITSPLVDAAALLPTNPQTDSRGLARSSDGDFDGISLPDIGAGEINIRYVTTATDETLDPGTGVSLREAVADPQPTDLIGFVPALHGSTLTLSQGAIPVSGQAEIIGPDDGITLDANQTGRHFSVEPGGFLAIAYLTLTGGNGTGLNGGEDNRGGSIFNLGRLVLIGCTLHGNSAAADGGAIFNKDSDGMLLYACTLDGNSCVGEGGAIYTLRADSQLYSCTLTRNQSGPTRRGGGILVRGGSQTRLANCLIEGNLAGTGGGPNILVENPSDLTVAGALLMDDYAGSTVSPGGDLLLGDGRLSPLGDFGGPTPVRLPLPESDALDAGAGNNLPEDQRGVVRSAVYDIGAVEFQGGSEFTALWETDDDGDGVPFGVELALGFDPFSSSPSAGQAIGFSRNVFGQSNFSFPLDPAVAPYTIWVVERSSPGLDNFQEIYRLAGPTDVETSTSDVSSNYSGAGDTDITITDENPPGGSAFYRFRALQAP